MIDEAKLKKFDRIFGTVTKIFPNIITIETSLDEWKLEFTDKKYKGILLSHKNKQCRKSKYHFQGKKSNLYEVYSYIYRHDKWMPVIKKASNTYKKG
ncbi:MAG: hypothetical protein PHX40_04635 [Bacilli bacterium]|nr:hypothetical protein [Bacilli bacterium]